MQRQDGVTPHRAGNAIGKRIEFLRGRPAMENVFCSVGKHWTGANCPKRVTGRHAVRSHLVSRARGLFKGKEA